MRNWEGKKKLLTCDISLRMSNEDYTILVYKADGFQYIKMKQCEDIVIKEGWLAVNYIGNSTHLAQCSFLQHKYRVKEVLVARPQMGKPYRK